MPHRSNPQLSPTAPHLADDAGDGNSDDEAWVKNSQPPTPAKRHENLFLDVRMSISIYLYISGYLDVRRR